MSGCLWNKPVGFTRFESRIDSTSHAAQKSAVGIAGSKMRFEGSIFQNKRAASVKFTVEDIGKNAKSLLPDIK